MINIDISKIKKYIFENDKVEYVLSQIGCKNIKRHDNYFTCGNYEAEADNSKAIVQYFNNEYLNCINHTRDIRYNKKTTRSTSIVDLVCFNKNLSIYKGIEFLCNLLGLDYYSLENDTDVPESLKVLEMLYEMKTGDFVEDNYTIAPISEKILTYYRPYVNDLFANDGIPYQIQKMFEIGYDDYTDYITIPIRDELGNLIGVKGRAFKSNYKNKYIALERYAKSKLVYALDKSIDSIKKNNNCFILEAEKSVMQLYGIGVYNCVAIGGHEVSKAQIIKLANVGIPVTISFDKDVSEEDVISTCNKIKQYGIENIYYMIDKDNILDEKQSPSDNSEKWKYLIQNNIYRFEG